MSNLTVSGITKNFGAFRAVDKIDLTVAEDEVLCLLGPSGCGKTTTLRMIAGLESVSSGEISFDDTAVTALPAQDRNVAMAFQFYALYPDLTVGENLIFPLAAEGLSTAEMQQRLDRIAETLQLSGVLHRPSARIVGGAKNNG